MGFISPNIGMEYNEQNLHVLKLKLHNERHTPTLFKLIKASSILHTCTVLHRG